MYENTKYLPCGECGIVLEFGQEISKEINAKIRQSVQAIEAMEGGFVTEIVPTYRSVLVQYDPLKISHSEMLEKLKNIKIEGSGSEAGTVKLIEIPTVYGGEYGPDMKTVVEHSALSEEDVVKIHTGTDYLVYMLGFIPGFTYLGGMDKRIATPRLKTPRTKIIAGSVGIAGEQTGIYPSDSPGGWQIIGRTPLNLFDAPKEPPVFINAGDYIRYAQVSEAEFLEIEKQVKAGSYQVNIRTVKKEELNE